MSRIDKYDPVSGGFRAPLAAAILAADKDKVQAVSIDANGRAAIGGAAVTAISGLICPGKAMAAGEQVDAMTAGEILEATATGGGALTVGAPVFAHADGTIDSTATAGVAVGIVVQTAGSAVPRLVVRVPTATT